MFILRQSCVLGAMLALAICGCSQETESHPLDPELARASVEKAMQAWVDGKSPKDLQSEIVVGDTAWTQGRRLLSFKVVPEEETTDGSNLHIRVIHKFDSSESKVTYIVGTSPVITIFPQ